MNGNERRVEILKELEHAKKPVSGTLLAKKMGVSRQVIVQDMAVIRASTPGILSTTKGYAIQQENTCTREFKVRHRQDQAAEELNLLVDCGGKIKNIAMARMNYFYNIQYIQIIYINYCKDTLNMLYLIYR